MPMYKVILVRKIEQSTSIKVVADSAKEAMQRAGSSVTTYGSEWKHTLTTHTQPIKVEDESGNIVFYNSDW